VSLDGWRAYLLCEDADHERFVRHYLYSRGVKRRHIYAAPLTSRGAGEAYVRARYPIEVQAHRARSHDAHVALIVVVDADQTTVAARTLLLDEALHAAGHARREAAERIVVLIPKRNVETWVAYLTGVEVDEVSDYKPRPPEAFRNAAATLSAACAADRQHAPRPASLVVACAELQRLR
jgi:hypothetical protein